MSALSEAQVIALAISELTAKPLLFPMAMVSLLSQCAYTLHHAQQI